MRFTPLNEFMLSINQFCSYPPLILYIMSKFNTSFFTLPPDFQLNQFFKKINFPYRILHASTNIPILWLWASSHGGMKRSRETDDTLNVDRLFTGLVRGSVPDGRSAFSRVAPATSCSCVRGIEVPMGDKSDDEGPVSVEVREDELGEGVYTESVVGEGAEVGDTKRGGTKISNGGVVDESEEDLHQQRTSPKKCDGRNVFTSTGKDEEKKEASYPYHHQRQPLHRAESFTMLKKMVETQNRWLPEMDKVTRLPMSKKWSPYAYEKRWKFMTWMVSEERESGGGFSYAFICFQLIRWGKRVV